MKKAYRAMKARHSTITGFFRGAGGFVYIEPIVVKSPFLVNL